MSLFRQLSRLEGSVDRKTYFLAGVGGFALKYAIDWTIATLIFQRSWSPISYWRLVRLGEIQSSQMSPEMFLYMLLASIPFLWFGMAMTLLRLRDASRSAGWAALFFVPVINVYLFAVLCLLPSRPTRRARDLSGILESSLFAVVGTVAIATVLIGFTTMILETYGIGLFVAVPFCVGYLTAFLHRRRHPEAGPQPYLIAALSILLLGGFLLALSWEGVICLAMALPLALVASMIGALLGIRSAANNLGGGRSTMAMAALPLLLILEATFLPEPATHRVNTSIDVDAPIQEVWSNVVSFRDISAEPEWYFRAGIAYPLRARVEGHGAGAIRYCEFTTGAFIEPIEIWNEPHLLRFAVSSNPPPLRELSPHGAIDPPHLRNFMISQRGQFALESLPDGRTRIIGTTWYQHRLWPGSYWTVWSDAIIHRIHMRVLVHVKERSEQNSAGFSS